MRRAGRTYVVAPPSGMRQALEPYATLVALPVEGEVQQAGAQNTERVQNIPVGRGVCGTAVAEDANQVVTDVRQLDNYLACSVSTRSEIVVLIRDENEILGQIDIDGHQVGQFDQTDEAMLERVAAILAARWE